MAQSKMIQEHISGNGSGDGNENNNNRSSKNVNNKPKKVPQRGLGVAQLEKIISEEQRNKEIAATNNVLVPGNFISNPSSCFPITQQQSHFGDWSRMLIAGDYNVDGDKVNNRTDNLGFRFRTPYEMIPCVPQRLYQVNTSSGISPSSYVINAQIEPPSNQIFRVNSYPSSFPDSDKTIGRKRPYPFTLESSSIPSLSSGFRPPFASKKERYAMSSTEPRNTCVGDGPSNLNRGAEPIRSEEVIRDHDNARLSGDFLTLAPPNVSPPPLRLKDKCSSDHEGLRLHGFKYTSQEHVKGDVPFSFFPVMSDSDPTESDVKGEEEEKKIDLDLKL